MGKVKRLTTTPTVVEMNSHGHYAAPEGMVILTSRLRTDRMERLLRFAGLTPAQHKVWVGGWTLKQYIEANPALSERSWWDMVQENLELFVNPLPLLERA